MEASVSQIYPNRGIGFFGRFALPRAPLLGRTYTFALCGALWLTFRCYIALGASLYEILVRLKADPQTYPAIHLTYSASQPLHVPVVLELPANGFRLRFDGLEQRLRLVEVLDFTKARLAYRNNELVRSSQSSVAGARPAAAAAATAAVSDTASSGNSTGGGGPLFRQVYNRLFGPTFPGEYVPPPPPPPPPPPTTTTSGGGAAGQNTQGTYILSYPGIAFSFPLQAWAWAPDKDFVSLLSSSAASPASALAVFSGTSWSEARQRLFSARSSPIPRSPVLAAGRTTNHHHHAGSDEIDLVKVHGDGQLELIRRSGKPVWIILGQTAPQDLVAELGPPDAIYRKNDRRLSIHGAPLSRRPFQEHGQWRRGRRRRRSSINEDDAIIEDTDQSSSQTTTSDDDDDDDENDDASVPEQEEEEEEGNRSQTGSELFYNYFRHGFDVFVSTPAAEPA